VTEKYPLKGSTVLVTGGAGLIGSHIVDRLIDEGAGEIRILDNLIRGRMDNLASARARKDLNFIQGDVRDVHAVNKAVAGCDYVFHQAAIRITLCAEKPRECMEVLVMGAYNIFEAAVAQKVKKVVYASSASVYGGAEIFPTDEKHHPYGNRTIYGAAKVMNEGIARSFADMYGLQSVGLRYFNAYGSRMDVTGAYTEVFIRWLEAIEQNRRPQIHGDGSASMDFVNVQDIARANILAMKSDRVDDVYNVASGTETSLLGLWKAMLHVTGAKNIEPEFHPPRKVNPVPRRLASTEKAKKDLGFVSQISLEQGLRQLLEWRKETLAAETAAAAKGAARQGVLA
jgi:UDP-glucose 4-epimerase